MSKLPLEELKEKYIPVADMPDLYNISVAVVNRLIKEKGLRYAEFRAPGDFRRTPHVNPEDVIRILEEDGYEFNCSL